MKHKLLFLLAILIGLPGYAETFDYTYEGQTLTYEQINDADGICKVIGSPSAIEGDLTIPTVAIDGEITYRVMEIGSDAFRNCVGMTFVEIPNSVTEIGSSAFRECIGLTSVLIPGSVTSLGYYVFYGCSNLTSIHIPNSVTSLGSYAFYGCSSLTSIDIPNSVTLIKSHTFHGCSNLTSIDIPNSVTSIGFGAFDSCINLTSIDIPNSVTTIEGQAFYYCKSLTSINLPNSITTIGPHAFSLCSGLTSIVIPELVTAIKDYTFSGCYNLTSIDIPNSVTSIGQGAFNNCSRLTAIDIPNSVSSLKDYVFSGCNKLTAIEIPHSVTSIGEMAFYKCTSLTSIKIPNSVVSIDSKVFAGCSSLRKVDIEEIAINEYGENDEEEPNSVILKLSSNGSDPLFVDCPLDEVYIGRKLEYDSSASAGYSPFYRNTSLRSIEISDVETEIYDNEFYGCSNLQSVKIGDGVKSFGNYAFSGCSKIESFEFGRAVETIGDEAFSDCTALTSLVSHSTTPPVCGTEALDDINRWECTLHIPAEATDQYAAADQWNSFLFMIGDVETEKYFEYNNLWFRVTDLDNLQCEVSSPDNAPAKARRILKAEEQQDGSTTLDIPHHVSFGGNLYTVTGIGENAFSNNSTMSEVVIPASVNYISKGAFSGCNALSSVKVLSTTPPDAHEEAFDESHYTTVVLDYPEESHSDYQAHSVWSRFANITTSINDIVKEESEEIVRYDSTGKPVDAEYRGLIIIRYSNGNSVKKIVR